MKVYVRKIDNSNEIIREIVLHTIKTENQFDKFLDGLLSNIDTKRHYVDTSEISFEDDANA